MRELKEFINLYRNNPWVTVATLAGLVVGGVFGVIGFYGNWLG